MTPTIIRELRDSTGLTQKQFADLFHIPLSTLRKWEQGTASPPDYVLHLIAGSLPSTNRRLTKIGGDGNYFYYDAASNTLEDRLGNRIAVKADLSKVKPQNLPVYVSDLFNSYYEIVERFERDCHYDEQEDIIWSSEEGNNV